MGSILVFPTNREPRLRESAGPENAELTAGIVIFPGVRIERHGSIDEPPRGTVGGGPNRRIRKTS